MNKRETLQIMAMLNAYYGQGKSDPESMVNAWYLILKDYDYTDAEYAVVEYARNDVRDYATFPAPGILVKTIKEHKGEAARKLNHTWNILLQLDSDSKYEDLDDIAKEVCNETQFDFIKAAEYEDRPKYRERFIEHKKQLMEGAEKC